MKKKILDNYLFVNKAGKRLIMDSFEEWAEQGISNPAEVFNQIGRAGGFLEFKEPMVGWYLFGNMYNHDNGLSGELASTSKVISLSEGENGTVVALTESGSSYLLLSKYQPANIYDRLDKILAMAPEPLAEYLRLRVPFWAPETIAHNLSVAVNKFVTPSSSDETTIAIYAVLCGCSVEEIRRQFKADGI